MPLTDDDLMPYFKYAGTRMKDVPAKYLLWLEDNLPPNYENDKIIEYIKANKQILINKKISS